MADDDFLKPENLPVLPESLGIRMLEADSIDRVVDGLKMAAEGAMALHYHRDDRDDPLWMINVRAFDALRITLARRARSKPSDQIVTSERDPGGTQITAYVRVYDGLKMAAQACRQIASGHRGDLNWSKAANLLEKYQQGASKLVRTRKRQANAPSILLPN